MKTLKSKEIILKEAFSDIMYSSKTINDVLNEVYELGFAKGFKQENDNAKEVADFEQKKITQAERDLTACRITIRNSYLQCLYGDKQLAYVFFNGMKYADTGELPEDLLDNEEFVNRKNV